MRSELKSCILAALIAISITLPSQATENLRPQVLGLIATATPTPLTCADGVCSGFFSTFCMQEKRPKPVDGQRYDLAGRADPLLVVRGPDGQENRFSGTGLLEFTSEGRYTAIRVTMATDRLVVSGPASFAIEVPRGVALVPHRPADDPVVQQDDRALAAGPRRFAAESFFEHSNPRADAALVMSRLINLLPHSGPVPARTRHEVWDRSIDPALMRGLTIEGIQRARDSYDRCNYYADAGYRVRLRGCLDKAHDMLLKTLNRDFWESETGW